ncbi:hypothetical protein AM571_CH03628 [Rhizobium etli 8C-3]|uniref:Uncharacterized protein n=2 Tax=Rhizobium TaxID=379 RepID=A0A4V2V9N7_9HYPH|nr:MULTISPECIES: hypothetical protein [Rhizobium]APO76419.1 hypothetical protein AM571_CH03628 [Rhizobium etli 8C-3]TCU17825.1 hypothetical protein EV130_11522 [Rhizobium azibense]TCU31928.1 hypothetical protein EV129_12322 [Rhizobium azibense]
MTQDLNRIEIDLQRMSEGWTMPSGNPIQMPPDYPAVPNLDPEAHLMTFSVMPRETILSLKGRALQSRASQFTLYVTGTRFGLLCYSLGLVRLVEAFEELCPTQHSVTIH